MAPPAKRRRKSSSSNTSRNCAETSPQSQMVGAPQSTIVSDTATTRGADLVPQSVPGCFGVTFADFPAGMSLFDASAPLSFPIECHSAIRNSLNDLPHIDIGCRNDVFVNDEVEEYHMDHDSGKGSSLETLSEGRCESWHGDTPANQDALEAAKQNVEKRTEVTVKSLHRKRRRSSSTTSCAGASVLQPLPFPENLLSSTNNVFLAEGLLKIYHDSFENALSCWLTERTCPYSRASEVALVNEAGPDWNRIYHRVFRLDRVTSPIRGRGLTCQENKAVSRALNLAIFAFATQWAQSGQRSKAKYPFDTDSRNQMFTGNAEVSFAYKDFDRSLQISAWNEARIALQNTAEIESFRIVLAQMVFSLTQRPSEPKEESTETRGRAQGHFAARVQTDDVLSDAGRDSPENEDVSICEDLLSKLDLAIEGDGPPVHLEQGLRLLHSLKSRVALSGTLNKSSYRYRKPSRLSMNNLDHGDRATIDLLFWLGVMLDTLSSAMHKRPLVVSDEDSDIYVNAPRPSEDCIHDSDTPPESISSTVAHPEGLWDDYLFGRQRGLTHHEYIRWPCSFDQAASLLCDAAPVKVLLFRKVCRIQTLLSRNIRGEKLLSAVDAALDVYDHWQRLYAPFIRDCIGSHNSLPSRIQSWYICLAGHWHLATLLLADLLEVIEDTELFARPKDCQRWTESFVRMFRKQNCYALSELADCACPSDDASSPKSGDFHFAVNEGALLTEPWTAVLIRAFAKAGVALLETKNPLDSDVSDATFQEDAFRRADHCVKALWYLGRKSDMALAVGRILGDALKQRRKSAEEQVNDMSCFLEAELWEGFDGIDGALGVQCI